MIPLPVYLVGYMGAGKTTVGRLLAQKLDWSFVDTDEAFLEVYGTTPAQTIVQEGETVFRQKEKNLIEKLSELPIQKVIYATGGGYPCYEDNMECLLELGTVIYLKWSAEHLARRLLLTDLATRPLLQGKNATDLLKNIRAQQRVREAFYAQSHWVVEAPLAAFSEENDEQIAQWLYEKILTETL